MGVALGEQEAAGAAEQGPRDRDEGAQVVFQALRRVGVSHVGGRRGPRRDLKPTQPDVTVTLQ